MKEISEIIRAVTELGPGERAVLATVVDLKGSGYRLPGARMVIKPDGRAVGTVSGGCLEADVLERSNRVLAGGRPEIFTYDTTTNEDSVFSMNMGCRGVIRILLEPVHQESRLIESLRRSWNDREPQFIASLISGAEGVGGRAFLNVRSGYATDHLPPEFENSTQIENALRDFAQSQNDYLIETFEMPGGPYEFALERVTPPVAVLLFGAGADAMPLADLVVDVGWQVTVHDHRPGYLTAERFPAAKELILLQPDEPPGQLRYDDRTAVVVMTHNYSRDLQILPAVLSTNAFYIGLLGPKSRTTQLLNEIAKNGQGPGPEQVERLYAPIGLDIGGQTPEAIALAIVAEIQSVLRSRSGGHLRDREGSIYGRS